MKEDALQKGLPVPDEAAVREQVLRENVEAPDLATVKDFLRFQAATSKGKIQEEVTCDSLNTFAEWFFAGFSRVRRPKHLFTERDARRLLRTPWTEDDPIFIPERYRIQFHYIFLEFCWTGARLGAFFTDGLHYRVSLLKLVL